MVERKEERKKGGKKGREEGLVAAAVLVNGLLSLSSHPLLERGDPR